jgi:DNA replication and repair protein RecF
VRFGADGARVALTGRRGNASLELEVLLRGRDGKRVRLNGASLPSVESLRTEVAALVFTPDRLGVVKSAPIVRRAYFDRALGRLLPARADVASAYGAALAQRNAALRRVRLGLSSREALDPWTARVAALGAELVAVRGEAVALLAPAFGERAAELGLRAATLRYAAEPPTVEELALRLDRDVERGTTGIGPHLDDVGVLADGRDLRLYGSQGEQRVAVLALLLAEAEVIAERRGVPPLLLLDDVLSELDLARRKALAARVAAVGQTLVTATAATALPAEPSLLLDVSPGVVRRA